MQHTLSAVHDDPDLRTHAFVDELCCNQWLDYISLGGSFYRVEGGFRATW
jgi:hypothetical protein